MRMDDIPVFALRARVISVAILLILMGLSARGSAQVVRLDGSKISGPEIDQTVARLMKEEHVIGAGVAVFNGGHISYLKTFGFRDAEKRLPLTPRSVMTAASLTKAAFAVMVMKLVEDGTIQLDKPVFEYLPEPLPDYPGYTDLKGDPRYKLLTMRMLLDHTSGFPNLRRFTVDKKLSINFTPGTRFAYSGEGIRLAQFVVEKITQESTTTLMKQFVFKPLDMTRTSMIWESRFRDDFANGYDEKGRSLGPELRPAPDAAGSMQTTLHDYALFVQALLQDKILGRRSLREVFRPQIAIHSLHEFPSLDPQTTRENDSIALSYGLGFGLYRSPYGEAFFKEGHDEGWRHYVVGFRDVGSGILIMTNSSNGEDTYSGILETVLEDTFTPLDWEQFKPSRLH